MRGGGLLEGIYGDGWDCGGVGWLGIGFVSAVNTGLKR